MKKALVLLLTLALLIPNFSLPIFAATPIKVQVDGKPLTFDVAPASINGRTLVPLRQIFEALGTQITWDGDTKTVTGTKDGITIILKVDSKEATVNGKKVVLDVPAKLIKGRVLVPTRFIAESFGTLVEWDDYNNTVYITNIDPQVYLDYAGDPMLNYEYMVDQVDTDGDGLTDYEEAYKYLTNPTDPDSDKDGIKDGGWEERKEYTYTITARRELDSPFNSASLKDTFQDIKVISETSSKLVYDVVLYPFAKDLVTGDSNWKENSTNPTFAELLRPRKTTNWDAEMQAQIVNSIPSNLTNDLDVVKFLIPYYLDYKRLNPIPLKDFPSDFLVDLRSKNQVIYRKDVWQGSKVDPKVTDEVLVQQILFAKTMFEGRIDGACTASATYMATILRAAGIPARIIETNSLLDYGDPTQKKLLYNLDNAKMREHLFSAMDAYYGHYYIEAYVDGRWIKINNDATVLYSNYSPEINNMSCFTIKADTFFDFSDTTMVNIFKTDENHRPYRMTAISDKLGVNYKGDIVMKEYKPPTYSWLNFAKIFGADINGYNLVGGAEFCGERNPELLYSSKVLQRCGLSFLSKNIFNDKTALIISTEELYAELPSEIRSKISETTYNNIGPNEYELFKVSNAQVMILNRRGY